LFSSTIYRFREKFIDLIWSEEKGYKRFISLLQHSKRPNDIQYKYTIEQGEVITKKYLANDLDNPDYFYKLSLISSY
jgi:hypothetical protein